MKVFINQFEDKFEWHSWFKDMMEEQSISYSFKERGDDDSDIEDKKEKADFIVYIFSEDMEPIVEHATNALLDSENYSEKIIYRILEDGKNLDNSVKDTLKKIEKKVEDNGGKIVNAPAHAINYIKYVEKEGEEYKGDAPDNPEEDEENEMISEARVIELKNRYKSSDSAEYIKSKIEDPKLVDNLQRELDKMRDFVDYDGMRKHYKNNIEPILTDILESYEKKESEKSPTRKDLEILLTRLISLVMITGGTILVNTLLLVSFAALLLNTLVRSVSLIFKTPFRLVRFIYNTILDSMNTVYVKLEKADGNGVPEDRIEEIFKKKIKSVSKKIYGTLIKESMDYNGGGSMNKISNSNIFQYLNNVLNLNGKIDKFLNSGREVNQYNCEIDFKRFENDNHPYKNMILNMMEKGKIKLLYNEDSSLSRSLMFIPMFKNQDDYVLYINVTSLSKEEEYVEGGTKKYRYEFINHKALFNVLISGYALIKVAQKPNLISHNHKVKKSVFELYSEMMLGTINRIGSLSNDKNNAKIVKYILAKYFHLGMLGRKYNDKIEESCITMSDSKGLDKIEILKMKYNEEDYSDITSTLEIIDKEFSQLDIDLPSLVKIHTMLYGEGTLLTIDYIPYIIALAFSERFRFAIYTSSKNLRKNFKLPANDIQVNLMDKLK